MRQRLVSVGIVMIVAGTAQTGRAQQSSSNQRGLREQGVATAEQIVAMAQQTAATGWINYVFPEVQSGQSGRYSNELYAGVSHGSYLNPSFRVFQDVHAGTGTYVNAGVSHTYPVMSNKVTLMPSVAVGYNHKQWIDVSTFSDLNVGLRATVPGPVKHLWLAPFINYSRSLDRAVLESKTYGGVSVAVR